jgi:starch synthase
MKKVAFITTEMVPFAKVGGLGDVSGSLPIALQKKGVKLSVFLPLYKQIDLKSHKIKKVKNWKTISIILGENSYEIDLFTTKYSDIDIYFIANEYLFGRDGVYTDKDGHGFMDNHIRDIFFSKAIMEVCKTLGENDESFRFDTLHINDSHTALIAPYLKTVYHSEKAFENSKSVLTIHNLGSAYQGIHESVEIKIAGLSYDYFYQGGPFEFYGKFNFLKAGIEFADFITTVSPTYAKEIQTPELGEGLFGVLQEHKDKIVGILNGIDEVEWNPETDKSLVKNFSKEDLKGKTVNKKAVLEKFLLNRRATKRALIGVVTRLVEQKGMDIIQAAFDDILALDVNIVVLGMGQKKYEEMFKTLSEKYGNKVGVMINYDNQIAHLIEGGADIFLMPSRYEPCGLNQFYSLKYGTIPLVRGTGGLEDSITNFNPETGDGNGFKFYNYSGDAIVEKLKEALDIYNKPKLWKKLVKNAMSYDSSWEKSAELYIEIYNKI